jgi:VanZ family protein
MSHASRQDEPAEPRSGGSSPHGVRLAWILALAYLLVIAYASLQPFRGWRAPPQEVLHFLFSAWPPYVTLRDVAVNVAAYLPLGFLFSIACGARIRPARGAIAATLAAAMVSLAMEAAQMFLPARIASNIDLLANTLGALLGAMAAPLFAPTRILGGKLHAAHHHLFRDGMKAEAGLVIVGLWLITQLHPTAQPFGSGGIRVTFNLPAYLAHTPSLALGSQAMVVLLSLTGVGLMVCALMRDAARPLPVIATLIAAVLLIKIFTAVVFDLASAPVAWLTPGVMLGVLVGSALLYGAAHLPRLAQLAVAAGCIAAATAVINLAPDNPYHSVPSLLLARGTSHFLSFSSIVRALSELWPLLAIGYLAWVLGARAAGSARDPI